MDRDESTEAVERDTPLTKEPNPFTPSFTEDTTHEPVHTEASSVRSTVEAVPQPTISAAPVVPATHPPSSAGMIVLQWLTYAFWGWLVLALIWLMGVVASGIIADADVSGMIPYAIAATVVLLPIAFVTDLFYRRHEPTKKVSAASIVMVIHAVIFALCGIGSLILAVFTVLSMFVGTDGGDIEGQTVAVVTASFATVLYVAAFVRTLNPFKTRKLATIYAFVMLAVALIVLTMGVLGPMVKAVSERGDRRIEANLESVQSGITTYVEQNKKLPNTLGDVTFKKAEARSLVDDGLVRYEKGATVSSNDSLGVDEQDSDGTDILAGKEYRYKLCVTYQGSSSNDYDSYDSGDSDEYQSYLSTYAHPAGEVCYKLVVDSQSTYYSF